MPLIGGSQNPGVRFGSEEMAGTFATIRGEFKLLLVLSAFCGLVYGIGLSTVPVLDRDEARFAQATYQMIETGDYWRISFQESLRTKKPHGIHWLQSIAVRAFSDPQAKEIWVYRLPSAIGAWLAVILTFFVGRELFGRTAAFSASILLAMTPILIAEAHIATADAALLATIVAAQWPLARAYLSHHRGTTPPDVRFAVLFWIGVVGAILIKGPVGPGVIGLTILTLVIADRRAGWLKALWPVTGSILALGVLGAWAWQASLANDGSFVAAAMNEDFLPKLFEGQESHGAPPGTHTVTAVLALGAALPFAAFGLVYAIRERNQLALRFCLAWLVPAWLVFELVSNKLPHYPLPMYPALALLAGYAVQAGLLEGRVGRTTLVIWGALTLTFLIGTIGYLALPAGQPELPSTDILALAFINIFSASATIIFGWRGQPRAVMIVAVTASAALAVCIISVAVPRIEPFWITERIHNALDDWSGTPIERVVAVGYHEPSLVFRLGTETALSSASEAGHLAAEDPNAAFLVETRERPYFEEFAAREGSARIPSGSVSGFNYSSGRWTTVWLYMPR